MTITAAIVKELVAAGLTGDALVAALERIESSAECLRNSAEIRDEQAERRRAADRERKRRLRNSAESAEIPEQKSFDKEIPPTPPKEITTKNKPTASARATRLPDDFEPDASCHALAEKLLLTTAESQIEFDAFLDHWRSVPGSKGLKLDWQATFRNWLRNNYNRTRNGKHRQAPTIRNSFAILDAVADEAIRQSGGFGPEGGEENTFGLSGLRKSAA